MGYLRLLVSTSLLYGLVLGPVAVQAADVLAPRAEVSVKGGSQRSMLTTEFWAPLAQKSDRVVYADVRLMGDNDENREGNLGFGYRQISKRTSSVLGVHGWIDRRRTEYNSTFHQATLGVESLGDKLDLRASGYVPLNSGRTVTLPNIGSTTPYLAGNGLFYDTNGFVNETPQYGLDAEAGYRLPLFEKHVDALRVYGGGYHFFRSNTENVTGFRIRTEAQINKLVSVGARFQHDGPRGSQGFLEATLRFPFSAKKLYQTDKLRSRLDESPERDIDIVTASKVDTGLRKEILTTDSNGNVIQQRILYVDNTNAQTGDGTKENPFNNLTSAQNALQANDILYVFHGDGTTTGMDQGITITQNNVKLIGSGSDLTIGGYTFLNAGDAPVITNTQAFVDDGTGNGTSYTGNGIFVKQGNISISGLTVQNANAHGIYVLSETAGTSLGDINISNVTLSGNSRNGVHIHARSGGMMDNVTISNITSTGNLGIGAKVDIIDADTLIKNISIENSIFTNNVANGLKVDLGYFAHMDTLNIFNNFSNGNGSSGIYVHTIQNSSLDTLSINGNTVNANGGYGIFAQANSNSRISDITMRNNISISNGDYGIGAQAGGTTTNSLVIEDNISNNNLGNTGYGLYVYANGSGLFSFVSIARNTTNGNSRNGIYINANNTAIITNVTIDRNQMNNNTNYGIHMFSQSSISTITGVTLSNNDITGNQTGVYLNSNGGILNADLGGGTFNSAGQNRIFDNSNKEIRLNYTSGGNVFAKYNWWGVNTGLNQGTRVTLSPSTTLDSTAHLTVDPRP